MEPLLKVLRGKIHRATVTEANVDYEGSITIPPELMQSAGLIEYQAVQVWDVTNGSRLETYAIKGLPSSSSICVNGAAAHLVSIGDIVIIACFMHVPESALKDYKPKLVFVDAKNKKQTRSYEIPGPLTPCRHKNELRQL